MSNPLRYIDPLGLYNYLKGMVAVGNGLIGSASIASGGAVIAGGAIASATGVGTPIGAGAIALGALKINAGVAAMRRAEQQSKEARRECSSDASLQNLLGLLPFGQNFDDPGESFDEFGRELLNKPASRALIDLILLGPYQ